MSGPTGSILDWLGLQNRDTSDVFFSCLTTISASTFLALHLHVPSPSPESKSVLASQFGRQLCWAAMVVVAPELLVSLAFGNWRAASIGLGVFRDVGRKNVRDWTLAHASFANMGGLKFEMQKGGREIPDSAPFHSGDRIVLRLLAEKELLTRTTMRDIAGVFDGVKKRLRWWRRRVFRRITALFRLLTRVFCRTANKGKAPALDETTLPRIQLNPESLEMMLLDHPEMCSSNHLTNDKRSNNSLPGNPGESCAGPSTVRPPSVDLGRVNISFLSDTSVLEANASLHETQTSSALQAISLSREDEQTSLIQEEANPEDTAHLLQDDKIVLYLNAGQIVVAQILGILDEGPCLSKDDIEDKGKSNVLVKGFAAFRLLWFATQVIIRVCRSQPLTQLELASSTYVLCAVLAYGLYWSKPQGVERPIEHCVPVSDIVRPVTDQDIEYLKWFGGSPFLERNFAPPFGMDSRRPDPTKPISTDVSLTFFAFVGPPNKSVLFHDDEFAGIIVGMFFGVLYCLGWNHVFPSVWEQWAWRAASVVITGSLIPYSIVNQVCTVAFGNPLGARKPVKAHIVHCLTLYTLLSVYIGCRIFMLVEMVRTLFI